MKTKYLFAALFISVIIAAMLALDARDAPQPVKRYATTTPSVKDLEQTVLGTGRLQSGQIVNIGSQVSGQIKYLPVQAGQTIKKGQLIAEIDSLPQLNALHSSLASMKQVQAQLTSSKATLAEARRNAERQKRLYENDVNSQQELEAVQTALEIAQANFSGQRSALEISNLAIQAAKVNLGHTRIVSPVDGDVIAVLAAEGQTVNANQVTPNLTIIANLDLMHVRVKISETDINKIKSGMSATFTLLGDPNFKYYTTIKSIDLAPESLANESISPGSSGNTSSGAVYYNATLEILNPDRRLRISMTAKVAITVRIKRDALTIPIAALIRSTDHSVSLARILDKGSPVLRKIVTGISDENDIEVLDGIAATDELIIGESLDEKK